MGGLGESQLDSSVDGGSHDPRGGGTLPGFCREYPWGLRAASFGPAWAAHPALAAPPNIQVSHVDPNPSGEPTLGVNRYGILLVDWEEQGKLDSPVGPTGFAISNDSGTTFGTQHIVTVPGASWQYDAATATTSPNGTMWFGYGACISGCSGNSLVTQDYLTAIWDNGSKWSQPISSMPYSQTATFVDRDWIPSTPNGTVYQTVDDATGSTTNVFLASAYDGVHFHTPQVIYGQNNIPIDAFAYNDTLWGVADLNTSNDCTIILSTNGGASWAPAAGSSPGCDAASTAAGGSISWQVTWGAGAVLDLVYVSNTGGVWFTQSGDLGATWSAPVNVVGTVPAGTAYLTPAIAASLSNGDIGIVWLDTRSNTATSTWYVYESDSSDHGTTWSPDQQLSDLQAGTGSGFWPGDFIGNTITPWGTDAGVWGEDDSQGNLQTYFGQTPIQNASAGSLTVDVVDTSSSPLSGAFVQLPGCGPARTDANGSVTYYAVPPGTYTATASNGGYGSGSATGTVTAGGTTTITITLGAANSVPTISAFTASPSTFTVGGTTYLNVSTSGGTGPLTYAYAGLPAPCVSSNSSTITCAPSAAGGPFSITVTVSDGASPRHTTSATTSFTVTPSGGTGPSISAFTTSPASIPAGGTTYLNATASGGVGPLTYGYSGLPTPCASSNSSTITCAPNAAGGPYTITVTVHDSASTPHSTSATTSFTVTPSGATGPSISAFTASPSSVPVGGTSYLNVTATGGVGPLSYAYSGLPSPCAGSNASSITCTPAAAGGPYTITVTVSDSATPRHTTTANTTLRVTPSGGSGPVITAFTATPAAITLGAMSYLNVTASGGKPPYAIAYAGLPSGCASQNVTSLACTPNTARSWTITVSVTDTTRRAASQSTNLTVTAPTYSALQISGFSASVNPVVQGNPTVLTVQATGGVLPYTYAYASLPPGCGSSNTSSLSCTPTGSGTYVVNVTVSDPKGQEQHASLTLTVNAPTAGGTGSSPAGAGWGLWALVAVIAAVAIIGAVLLLRRRTPASPPPPPPAPSMVSTDPPPWQEE